MERGIEYGVIEQTIYIEASPEVVYEVVSSPEHIANWYVDEAAYELRPGASGHFAFGARQGRVEVPITVVETEPGLRFSFRWLAPPAADLPAVGTTLTAENSLLVTFELTPQGDGTLLRVTESGLRELGWEAAVLEQYYDDHTEGWSQLLGRLATYVGEGARR